MAAPATVELLTFFQFPKRQWKTLQTTNVSGLNEEFRHRVKTPGALPTEDAGLVLPFGLVVSGRREAKRRGLGYQSLINDLLAEHVRRARSA